MVRKQILSVLTCLLLSAVNGRADDAATPQDIERLEQRIENLEKNQRAAETSESSESSGTNGMISIGGVISGVYQYEWVSGPADPEDRGRGGLSIQPEVGITPTEADEAYFKFGFAAGNGLPGVTAFNLAPWGADLEADLRDINGRNRDYLLTAWYRHTFELGDNNTLGLTGGLIDATDYLDDNAYAKDEYSQFLNAALINAPNAVLPSYDVGGAVEWDFTPFKISGVAMNVGENDDGNNFNFYGAQFMYTLENSLGEGHYRLVYNFSSEAFLDPPGTSTERRQILIFSFDQAFGKGIGAWIRFAFQDDSAAVDYEGLYSGGINVSGRWWGREQDTLGIGYAYLAGAEQLPDSIESSQVAEAYVNLGLNAYLFLTLDLQYLDDRYVGAAGGNDVDGWIAGARITAEF